MLLCGRVLSIRLPKPRTSVDHQDQAGRTKVQEPQTQKIHLPSNFHLH